MVGGERGSGGDTGPATALTPKSLFMGWGWRDESEEKQEVGAARSSLRWHCQGS